ncbi:EexN family lipoprotein [Rhizobium sp. CNPSo 3968]|uniref:EexN family lipoprotein n=1 Tax=Rhizobium sp. CNPSo 3968 TaxID=3021408 RepID=UPI00146A707B|nr:EexN family lipoprotein [Rhizobium sp. CNPSo 3968]MDK4719477.1 EexN family lipoprotein [Rhizobium sp. CNPSo 3968]
MKLLVLFTLGVSLFGCSKPERTYSVDELMANQTLLSDLIAKCKSNPGELRATPNCVNAEAADWKSRLERMGKALGG